MDTLGDILWARYRAEPQAVACTLVDARGGQTVITVEHLMRRAMAYAAAFGPPATDRTVVAVCLGHGTELHPAFIGGLWAGHVSTMLPPPSPRMEPAKYERSLRDMLDHVQPDYLVIDAPTREKIGQFTGALREGTRVVLADEVQEAGVFEPWPASSDDVALLQHSSGTTGLQKGVALSHRAVLAHHAAYVERLGIDARDRIASWLPLYHDMGFIACFWLPLIAGIPFAQMSAFDWVLRPSLLLEQISKQRATLCWLPNFAFAFLADAVREEQLSGLDLGSVRAFVNCSEPVLPVSFERFLSRFASVGARSDQLTTSYAMAENVFAATQSLPGQLRILHVDRRRFVEEHVAVPTEGTGALRFVSSGRSLGTTALRVVDGNVDVPAGAVGEIWLRGAHLFDGYFGRPDLTAAAIDEDGWYHSGDLGFVHEGEVYVTGRRKDLIIVNGKNYYPADVEQAAMRVEGVAPGRVVAFGLPDEASGTEKLIVLAELVPDAGLPAVLARKLRAVIAQELDCTPGDVRIVPPRWLVKSSSGKLARADNRDKYVAAFSRQEP